MTKAEYAETLEGLIDTVTEFMDMLSEGPPQLSALVSCMHLQFELLKELYRVTGVDTTKEITFKVDGKELVREVLNDNLS
ncbi:MAG: hypothetical protein IJG63_03330 [Oscillospiraceae bacterium]|nr:hypothetical protein [Oscillospiraceae bacterium]